MTRMPENIAILKMASELGLNWKHDPTREIIDYCIRKINGWVKTNISPVFTINVLEELICKKLCLVFVEIWTDEDLNRIIQKYIGQGEIVFADLRNQFDDSTYATLFERRKITREAHDRYVAVIDCRGGKSNRRYFTKWHEIAHLLTLTRQLELPFHRSTDRCPEEKLMDKIAGEIGFFEPIFRPALESAIAKNGKLTFEIVQQIRQEHCPDASFQASLIACIRMAPVPAIYVEATMALKKNEEARLNSNQLELNPLNQPEPLLRAVVTIPNNHVRTSGLRIDRNMQVPSESIIYSLWSSNNSMETLTEDTALESLCNWKHSNGDAVGSIDVTVAARHVHGKIIALVTMA